MKKRLCKSSKLRMICGVCGGLAEMLNWDPTIIRIIFVLLVLFKGLGLFMYLIMALIMPSSLNNDPEEKSQKKNASSDALRSDDDFNSYFEEKK